MWRLDQTAESVSSALNKRALKKKFFSAIIVAAGSGERMSGIDWSLPETGYPVTKQFLPVYGIPAVARTVMAFEACPFIGEIIVAARADEVAHYQRLRQEYGFKKPFTVVAGGNTRQTSVRLAFEAVHADADYVAIHDGARCLVTPEQIAMVCAAAIGHKAAAAACRARDTVKIADARNYVESTPDRRTLWQVQTPQVFDVTVYNAALHFAEQDSLVVTDDCALSEHIGIMPRLIDCGYENIKLTVPSDLLFAEAILRHRQQAKEGKV